MINRIVNYMTQQKRVRAFIKTARKFSVLINYKIPGHKIMRVHYYTNNMSVFPYYIQIRLDRGCYGKHLSEKEFRKLKKVLVSPLICADNKPNRAKKPNTQWLPKYIDYIYRHRRDYEATTT